MVQKVAGSIPVSHPISFKTAPEGAFLMVLIKVSSPVNPENQLISLVSQFLCYNEYITRV